MAQDLYYSRTEVSNSDLSELNRLLNPGLYTPDYTDSLRFGNLFDCLVTEPEKVNVYTRTVAGIDGTYSIADLELAREMKRAFYKDPTCASLMKIAECQRVSIGNVEFEFGNFVFSILMRCKWDLFLPKLHQGADIKTTTATTAKGFEDACIHFSYFRSRVVYMLIENTEKDMLIGVSKVNKRVFKIPIVRGDRFWQEGLKEASSLAFQHWLHFDGFGTNNLLL